MRDGRLTPLCVIDVCVIDSRTERGLPLRLWRARAGAGPNEACRLSVAFGRRFGRTGAYRVRGYSVHG